MCRLAQDYCCGQVPHYAQHKFGDHCNFNYAPHVLISFLTPAHRDCSVKSDAV